MISFEQYSQGNLNDAIAQALSEVRDNPSSAVHRAFLAELLCFAQDYERADKQLATLGSIDPQTTLTTSIWRQLIAAAQIRHDVFHKNGSPELIDQPTEDIKTALRNMIDIKEGSFTQLEDREQTYTINGQDVTQWRDLDDTSSYILEVLGSNGKYFWVDFAQVTELVFSPPQRAIDLLWRKASLVLTSGSEGEVFIPTIYPYTPKEQDDLMLGRATDWIENNEAKYVRGIGQRTWLVGEDALTIMEIESIYASDAK